MESSGKEQRLQSNLTRMSKFGRGRRVSKFSDNKINYATLLIGILTCIIFSSNFSFTLKNAKILIKEQHVHVKF